MVACREFQYYQEHLARLVVKLLCPNFSPYIQVRSRHCQMLNLPNSITLSRLLGIPLILYGLYQPSLAWQWASIGIFIIAAATDWLDGYLARKLDLETDLGKFLDPLVDKLLVLLPLLVAIDLHRVPAVGVCIILARELTIAGWRVGGTQVTGANMWGKVKTVVQIAAIVMVMVPLPSIQAWGIWVFWLAVALTLISGGIYLFPRKSIES
jgi:CDP-diacylglycerol---glycerol-3-phosphate 3-phosphatidyltransferase